MIQHRQWSQTLKLDHPDDPSMHVSHETIYRHIYAIPKNEIRKLFVSNLKHSKAKRDDVELRVTFLLFKLLIHKRFTRGPKKLKPEK